MSLREFAHLKNDEKAIAERWVKQVPIQGRREYDVHLDIPDVILPAYWSNRDVKNYRESRKKRIDLVVHGRLAIWVMEITPKLSKASVGGVMSYRDMYQKQFQPSLPIALGIIVEVDDPAYHETLKNNNIRLWVV